MTDTTPDSMRARWYAQPNDLIGGWCVMDVDATPGYSSHHEIADFASRRVAEHIAALHNAALTGQAAAADCLNDRAVEAAAAAIGEYPDDENLIMARLMLEAALPHIAVSFMAYEVGKAAGRAEEREACARLAEAKAAELRGGNLGPRTPDVKALHDLAHLIRQQP